MSRKPAFNASTRVDEPRRARTPSSTRYASRSRPVSDSYAYAVNQQRSQSRGRAETARSVGGGGSYAQQHQHHVAPQPPHTQPHSARPPPDGELRGLLYEIAHMTRGISERIQHPPSQQQQESGGAYQQQQPRQQQDGERISMSPHGSGGGGGGMHPQGGGDAGSAQPQTTTDLDPRDVERIVRRVEQHFAPKIETANAVINQQQKVITELKEKLAAKDEEVAALREQLEEAVTVMQRQSNAASRQGSPGGNGGSDGNAAVDALKKQLTYEKQQRLQCEEQAHVMAEQHNRVVHTLEERLRRQDKQIMDLQSQAGSANASFSVRQTPRSARMSGRAGRYDPMDSPTANGKTPSSPMQRAAAISNFEPTPIATATPTTTAVGGGEGPSSTSIPSSTGPAVPPIKGLASASNPFHVDISEKPLVPAAAPVSSSSNASSAAVAPRMPRFEPLPTAASAQVPAPPATAPSTRTESAARAADDVMDFLDTITKELDDISATEVARNAQLQRLV